MTSVADPSCHAFERPGRQTFEFLGKQDMRSHLGNASLAILVIMQTACVQQPVNPTEFEKDASGHLRCPRGLAVWSTETPLPPIFGDGYRGHIVPAAAAVAILCQCSRNTLGPADSYWSPTPENVAELEDALPLYVRDHPPRHSPGQWRELALFGRDYLGVVRDGTRRISVDLFPDLNHLEPLPEPGVGGMCDGGSMFFGVEYDIDRHEFTLIDYNGLP